MIEIAANKSVSALNEKNCERAPHTRNIMCKISNNF